MPSTDEYRNGLDLFNRLNVFVGKLTPAVDEWSKKGAAPSAQIEALMTHYKALNKARYVPFTSTGAFYLDAFKAKMADAVDAFTGMQAVLSDAVTEIKMPERIGLARELKTFVDDARQAGLLPAIGKAAAL